MKEHINHYLALLTIFAFGLYFFLSFGYNRILQSWVVIALSLAYFLWGVTHHYLEKDLHGKIVVEYFLIALLGAMVVISLLYRA